MKVSSLNWTGKTGKESRGRKNRYKGVEKTETRCPGNFVRKLSMVKGESVRGSIERVRNLK